MNSAPGAGKEEMVAAWKNPSPPGPEEAAAGEAVAAHIIILAAAAAWSPRAGQADTRAHTQPFSNDDGSGSGLSLQPPGETTKTATTSSSFSSFFSSSPPHRLRRYWGRSSNPATSGV